MIPLNLIMSFHAVSKEAIKQKGNCPRLTFKKFKYLIAGLQKVSYICRIYIVYTKPTGTVLYLHNAEFHKPDECDGDIIT